MSLRSILTTPFTFTTDQKKEIAFGDEKTMPDFTKKSSHSENCLSENSKNSLPLFLVCVVR
jgi:hypothetical protein